MAHFMKYSLPSIPSTFIQSSLGMSEVGKIINTTIKNTVQNMTLLPKTMSESA